MNVVELVHCWRVIFGVFQGQSRKKSAVSGMGSVSFFMHMMLLGHLIDNVDVRLLPLKSMQISAKLNVISNLLN